MSTISPLRSTLSYLLPFFGMILVLLSVQPYAQGQKSNHIPIQRSSDKPLPHAWAGGVNAPRFSPIDLNLDGIEDLLVFDKEGDRVMTFINNGTPNQVAYEYHPEYEAAFPEMYYWVIAADYNLDGKADLFTFNNGGIRVFKNTSTLSTGLQFDLVIDPYIISHYGSGVPGNLYTSSEDIPGIIDIDNDGDLDVLTFGAPSAQSVYLHENFAADSSDLESFKMHINTYCWGNFEEDVSTNAVTLGKSCPKSGGSMHSGSTILAFDKDHDGVKDLVLGDISFNDMVYLSNGGTKFKANITAQTNLFPNTTDPVNLAIFPAAYYLDVNNDGKKDLLISPNALSNMEDKNSVWYYKNIGNGTTDEFELVEKNFLQRLMMDFGSGAYPVVFDYNFNGTPDLYIGNDGTYNGALNAISGLQLYHNIGTPSSPKFELADEHVAGIDTLPLNIILNIPSFAFVPTFGDLDNDGDPDMVVGDGNGRLHYFENQPVDGYSYFVLSEANYMNIDVGQYAAPQLVDLDRDGKLDLVIGEQEGNLNFYRNIGTKQTAAFKLISENLGGVDTKGNEYDGNSQPLFYRRGEAYFLLCGAQNGRIYYYSDIDDNLNGTFALIDSNYLGIDVGNRSKPALVDFDNDFLYELVVGNYSGGLSLFETPLEVGMDETPNKKKSGWNLEVFGIDDHHLQISLRSESGSNLSGEYYIRNVMGQLLTRGKMYSAIIVPLVSLPDGLLLVSVKSEEVVQTKKFINRKP